MLPPKGRGTITYIAEPGDYKIDVSLAVEVTYRNYANTMCAKKN